ncbi:MAG TPA: glycerophosphodiester phosphodiesterase family protein [Pantanalinema sp.]
MLANPQRSKRIAPLRTALLRGMLAVLGLSALTGLVGCAGGPVGAPSARGAASFGILGAIPYHRIDPVPLHAPRFPAWVVAHRGFSSRFPENTVASFRAAAEFGADMVELDVQLTKDRQLVVMHDAKVDRTTSGKGEVKDLKFAQIRALDAGGKFKPEFAGLQVPTLEESLDAVRGKAMLNIEVKGCKDAEDRAFMASEINRLVEQRAYLDHVQVMSFDSAFMQEMRRQNPRMSLALLGLVDPLDSRLSRAVKLKMDGLNLMLAMLDSGDVDEIQKAGLRVNVWTVNKQKTMRKALGRGVNGLITNYPDVAAAAMDAHFNGKPMRLMQDGEDQTES